MGLSFYFGVIEAAIFSYDPHNRKLLNVDF